MYHYVGAQPDRSAHDLITLLNSDAYQSLEDSVKKGFIKALVGQMNNSVECSKSEIYEFLQFLKGNDVTEYLDRFYQHAPYPSLSTFISWVKPPTNPAKIQEQYEHFDKNPCAVKIQDGHEHDGREKENGFKQDFAKKQLAKMPKATAAIFTTEYLAQIDTAANHAKTLSTEALLAKLQEFKDQKLENHTTLVMYAIEMLHRCKGRKPQFIGDMQKPGRSFELNTTQILAILSMLETGNKVTAEIGTGEGKTRIMMILNACQFFKGNTVDFLTSNLALAERDYLDALPFYTSIGAKVNFITATSKIEDYQIGGINVSDPENLRLLRNKALSQNQLDKVLDPRVSKRALLLDEADVSYFDVANKQYNLSRKTPKINYELVPVFPILMDFFAEKETISLYSTNKEQCTRSFLARVEERNPRLYALLKSLPVSKIEQWQDAAYTAKNLKYNQHYTIVHDDSIPTTLGKKTVSAAKCLMNSRINEHAIFSEGVHQCLHAELNRLIKNPTEEPQTNDPYLKAALQTCQKQKQTFHINPERRITLSSSINTMIKDYTQGILHALTGTIGTELEQIEAQSNFGTNFLPIPRHKGLYRIDRPTRFTDSKDKQLDALIEHILDSRAKNQPILLLCKDDNESQEFFLELQRRLASKGIKDDSKLTRIDAANYRNGNTPTADKLKNEGGKPGQVIITTELLARGIEYELKEGAEKAGLKVLLTYLPKEQRDYGQSIGRGGRYGQVGESQMVLNIRALQQDFNIDSYNDNFYVNPEAFISNLQLFATYTKLLQRQFTQCFDNLLAEYTNYYGQINATQSTASESWHGFLEEYKISANKAQKMIDGELQQVKPNIERIEQQLAQHQKHVAELWSAFLQKNSPDLPVSMLTLPVKKPALLEKWFDAMQKLQNDTSITIEQSVNIKVHQQYESALAGRTAILQAPNTLLFFRRLFDNFNAWRKGEGLFLPNLAAYLSGQLSLTNYLSQIPIFNLFYKPQEETHTVKIAVPTSYALLLEKLSDKTSDDAAAAAEIVSRKGKRTDQIDSTQLNNDTSDKDARKNFGAQ